MAKVNQTWARDPEIAGSADTPSHPTTAGDSRPYADTDRFGKTQTGDTANIQAAQNLVSDPVWGVNNYAGGKNPPEKPQVPAAKGE